MRIRAAGNSATDPHARLPLPLARDEIRYLGTTFNDLVQRLQDALERERQFVSDAGHELRTPLSLLTTELELALRRPRSNPELLAAIRSALAETTDTARTTGGTGLGLAIVYTLSQRNHASVTARNRAAGGAEISLRLALG
ncbi:histidine kinase dimerization/phospho-acceptor domain-containing protein [Mycobacterium canetti]|uniref:histidine kinase dimerization/phospho-acceptor domain-containing protein n=1 Tax=Mycobacterium canetti TaxID=78331 RepID=UPI0011D24A18|nr:histidine kinase dimerization/phospho-acceptor domain-containing protein [Mycobacterium canetti]